MGEELLRRGSRLDRYEIREVIGKGGMGEVYRAWDSVLQRDVAIKVLSLRDADMLRRFEREAEAIGRLDNSNVVEIHDVQVLGEHPYIVMEYLRGQSLVERLKAGAMPIAEAVDVALGVCRGLGACHRVGIVHRDVKPANVFLAETPFYGRVVKVLDFGVSKPARYAPADLTGPGEMVGTPRYIAPERLKGMEADELSDQYGVGLLLYTALAGVPPFRGKERKELAWAILRAEYVRLTELRPDVPPALEAVIFRAIALDRARRFPSVAALGRALLSFASDEARELYREQFAEPTDGSTQREVGGQSLSGTSPTAPTVVMPPERLAELTAQSSAPGQTGVVVPVKQFVEEAPAPTPIPHLQSDTMIDSSLVAARGQLTRTHAGGIIETDGRRRRRRRRDRLPIVLVVVGGCAVLGVVVGLLLAMPRAIERAHTEGRWTTVPLDDATTTVVDGGPSVPGGGSSQAAEAQRAGHGTDAAARAGASPIRPGRKPNVPERPRRGPSSRW